MLDRTLKTLEYDKILQLVSQYAVLKGTKKRLLLTMPFTEKQDVLSALAKTEEAFKLLFDYGISGVDFFDEPDDEWLDAKAKQPILKNELDWAEERWWKIRAEQKHGE